MGPEIYIVCKIGSGLLAVMAKPVTGEWEQEEFRGIAQADIHQIVSLLEPHEAYELGLQDEDKLAEQHGMSFRSFPISDRDLPESAVSFAELAKLLCRQISEGTNTAIHCRAGIGRTGMLAAAIMVNERFSANDAFSLISEKRRVQVPDTPEQRAWVTDHAEMLGG